MATVPGGVVSTTTTVTQVSQDVISGILGQTNISEGNLTVVTQAGTNATQFVAPQVTTSGGSLNNSIIATSGDAATITGGGGNTLNISTSSTANGGTGNVVIEVKGSTAPTTAGAVTQQGSAIVQQKVADTPVGQAVQTVNNNLITKFVGTSTNASITSMDLKGGNGTDIVTVSAGAPTSAGGVSVTAVTLTDGVNVSFTGAMGSNNPILINTTVGKQSNVDLTQSTGNVNLSVGIGTVSIVSGSGNDRIVVGSGNASISGGLGADTIIAGSGAGSVLGGAGNNIVSGLQAATNGTPYLAFNLVINGFNGAEDKIGFDYAGVDTWEDFVAILATAKMVGNDTVATTRLGDKITITGVDISTLTQDMFVFG